MRRRFLKQTKDQMQKGSPALGHGPVLRPQPVRNQGHTVEGEQGCTGKASSVFTATSHYSR